MDLLLLGTGLGIVGGLIPSPLHLIALSQAALHRWARAIGILVGPPLIVDAALFLVTLFFYSHIPRRIAHDVAYVGGAGLLGFAGFALLAMRGKTQEELAESRRLTYASVWAATLAEVAAPGTWIYWLTVAGPVLVEARSKGYGRVIPFFAGGLVGYYGAAIACVWLLAWGASLHRHFRRYLFLAANLLLAVLGISYLLRARLGG